MKENNTERKEIRKMNGEKQERRGKRKSWIRIKEKKLKKDRKRMKKKWRRQKKMLWNKWEKKERKEK